MVASGRMQNTPGREATAFPSRGMMCTPAVRSTVAHDRPMVRSPPEKPKQAIVLVGPARKRLNRNDCRYFGLYLSFQILLRRHMSARAHLQLVTCRPMPAIWIAGPGRYWPRVAEQSR